MAIELRLLIELTHDPCTQCGVLSNLRQGSYINLKSYSNIQFFYFPFKMYIPLTYFNRTEVDCHSKSKFAQVTVRQRQVKIEVKWQREFWNCGRLA